MSRFVLTLHGQEPVDALSLNGGGTDEDGDLVVPRRADSCRTKLLLIGELSLYCKLYKFLSQRYFGFLHMLTVFAVRQRICQKNKY